MTISYSLFKQGQKNPRLPYLIWTGIGIFGALLSTFLPKTLNNPLPQTMEEAIQIGKNQSYFSCIHKGNVTTYRTVEEDEGEEMPVLFCGNTRSSK